MGLIVLLCLGVLAAVGPAESFHLAPAGENRLLVAAGACPSDAVPVTLSVGDYSTFTSPNYPADYGTNVRCRWSFQTSGPSMMKLICPDVRLSAFASIVVTDGSNSRKYNKDSPKQINQTIITQNVSFEFSNDNLFRAKGFSCTVTANAPQTTCTCGVSEVSRIVGGDGAQGGEFPWMAGVVNRKGDSSVFCGGALIDSQHVLTAAHCVNPYPNKFVLDVRLGVLDQKSGSPTEVRRKVLKIISHRDYDEEFFDNDIALLRIEEVDFTKIHSVRPICLPLSAGDILEGENVTLAGWGKLKGTGRAPAILQKVTVQVVNRTYCDNVMNFIFPITNNMFCAHGGSKDSCQGDSGGPSMRRVGAYYELVGAVSAGVGCGDSAYPGVYTRVAAYLPWIQENAKPGVQCPRP